MAASVTANLTDVTLGESADDTYWTGSDGYSAEIYRQGSASQGWIVSKNSNETATFDYYSKATATLDMSGTGVHLFITMRCDIAPFIDYVHFGLYSDTTHGAATTGNKWWTVVDNTTNVEWAGEWITIKLDVNSTTTFSSSGTLDLSAVDTVGINVDNSNSGNIRSIENTYIDAVRFGTGITITGTAWDWEDVAAIDNANDATNGYNKYDIIRKVGPGVFEVNGQLNIGSGATTTTPASSNETLFFKDISTSGIEGGPIGKQASGFYKVTVQGSGCTCDFDNMSILASSNATFVFDADDTNLPDASINWNGGTILQCSSFLSDGAQDFLNLGFYDCGQIEPAGSDFTDFLIDNYTGTDGAILWPGGTTVKDGVIQNSDRAIEITQTANQTFDNITFPSNTYDVHLNNSGTNIDVSKTNGSDPTNYVATGGGTVTFVGAAVVATIHAIDEDGNDVENARVFLIASDGTGPFPFEDTVTISNSGTTATVTHTAHGMATNDYVNIDLSGSGSEKTHYQNDGVFQITVTGTNTYTYTMLSAPGSSPTGTIKATFVAVTGLTNSSGVKAAAARVYASDQNVTGWIRKTPTYKTAKLFGTVDDVNGYSATGVLVSD
jgi:hypothetical protein